MEELSFHEARFSQEEPTRRTSPGRPVPATHRSRRSSPSPAAAQLSTPELCRRAGSGESAGQLHPSAERLSHRAPLGAHLEAGAAGLGLRLDAAAARRPGLPAAGAGAGRRLPALVGEDGGDGVGRVALDEEAVQCGGTLRDGGGLVGGIGLVRVPAVNHAALRDVDAGRAAHPVPAPLRSPPAAARSHLPPARAARPPPCAALPVAPPPATAQPAALPRPLRSFGAHLARNAPLPSPRPPGGARPPHGSQRSLAPSGLPGPVPSTRFASERSLKCFYRKIRLCSLLLAIGKQVSVILCDCRYELGAAQHLPQVWEEDQDCSTAVSAAFQSKLRAAPAASACMPSKYQPLQPVPETVRLTLAVICTPPRLPTVKVHTRCKANHSS